MGNVEDFQRGEVADDAVPDVVEHVGADVEVAEVPRADEQLLGEDGHLVVGEVDPLQPVGDPLALGEHLARDEGHLVVAEVDPADGEAVLEEAVRAVLQVLDPVVAQVQVAQRYQACVRERREVQEFQALLKRSSRRQFG